jgi:hypothetical protein
MSWTTETSCISALMCDELGLGIFLRVEKLLKTLLIETHFSTDII